MEADILPLHRGYSTENSDEDSKEWMLPTRGVEYAQVLFLEMDVQPSLLTQHHILKHLINVSTQSGEFADKLCSYTLGETVFKTLCKNCSF